MSIHRFNFSNNLNKEVQLFANKHMYDTKEIFKENFIEWCDSPHINNLIQEESEYLNRSKYNTDIKTKIYRSIKYYYVKKFCLDTDNNKQPKKREKINKIDPIIMTNIKQNIIDNFNTNPYFKPSDTFKLFTTTEDPIIKKCYKNQYYQIKNKMYNLNVN